MIYTAKELSRVMWEIDPMNTCCNVNTGMEDEYDKIAQIVWDLSYELEDEEAMKRAIIYWFDEYLYDKHKKALNKCLIYP